MMSAIVMAIVEFNALDPEHLDKLMLLRSHYKQSDFQSRITFIMLLYSTFVFVDSFFRTALIDCFGYFEFTYQT